MTKRSVATEQASAVPPSHYLATIESIADGVFVYDRDGTILQINAAARAIMDMDVAPPAPDLATQTLAERGARYRLRDTTGRLLAPEEYPIARVLRGEILTGAASDEVMLNTLVGKEIAISISGKPTYDESGAIDGAIIVYHDITAQKRAEQSLRDNEQRLRHIFDQAPVGLVCTGLDGAYLSYNQQFCDILGYTKDEMAHMAVKDISHPADIKRSYIAMQEVIDGIKPKLLLEKCYIHKTGRTIWTYINATLIRQEDGTPLYFLSIVEDLTFRRAQATQELAIVEAEARLLLLQQIIDQLTDAIYLVRGPDARLVLANTATQMTLGGTWHNGTALLDFLAASGTRLCWHDGRVQSPDELAAIQVARTRTAINQQQQVIRHADGTQLPVIINAVPFDGAILGWHDAAGQPEHGSLVTLQDVTAQLEAERLKSEFLALAAHELRTPIGVVSGYAQMLAVLLPETMGNAEQREILIAIQTAAGRLAQLANDLLDVTRLESGQLPLHVEAVNLGALIQRVVEHVRVTAPDHKVRVRMPGTPLSVMGDVQRLEQVLTNLLTNAVKYSPDGGDVVVTLLGSSRQGQAVVAVRDHGIGIPLAEQSRIFGRFARAENALAQGIMGTGLGLYLCRELMERQNGRIWFTSMPGRGTTFFIALPLAARPMAYEAANMAGVGTR